MRDAVLWLKGKTQLTRPLVREDGLLVAFRRVPQNLIRPTLEYAAKIVERVQPDLRNFTTPQSRRHRRRNVQSLLQLIRGRDAARLCDLSYLYFNHTAQSSMVNMFLQERIILLTGIPL